MRLELVRRMWGSRRAVARSPSGSLPGYGDFRAKREAEATPAGGARFTRAATGPL